MTEKFDYSAFPAGYYHEILERGGAVRRAWHLQKFQRVIDCLPPGDDLALLDIGCFAGTFLSLVDQRRFSRQVGVDVLPAQIEYAAARFGNAGRRFQAISSLETLDLGDERFHCVTIIEVIEHLEPTEVACLLEKAGQLLEDGGRLVLTTPNYASTWPLLELVINRMSDVSYEEQHITKFNFFNVLPKLRRLCPRFFDDFSVEFKTTTHFVSPFLAQISPALSMRSSAWLRHETWRFPLGNLLLMSFRRRNRRP